MKKHIKVGKHAIPLSLIVIILVSGTTVSAYAAWKIIDLSFEVQEPLELISYPESLLLYPGEEKDFSVTLKNHASTNYSVMLTYTLDNTSYQENYVTFVNKLHQIEPGKQTLNSKVIVDSDAPPVNATLNITFERDMYPSGLVGYWMLNEGTGLVAFDSSEYGNNGILLKDPSWVEGKSGTALNFDGVNDYVMVQDSQSLRLQSFTLSVWVYMNQRPCQHSADNHVAMMNKLDYYFGPAYGYKLDFEYPTSGDDDLVIAIGDGSSQQFPIRYNSINDLTLNSWHHIVGTFDGSVAKLYIDGDLKSTSGPVTYAVASNDAPLGIGQEVTGASGHFKGLMDNIMIFNRALSAEEISDLFTGSLS